MSATTSAALWRDNPGLIQLLGLCPLLAVTHTLVGGAALGAVTLLILTASGFLVALLRKLIAHDLRILVFVLIITVLVTLAQLALNAYVYPLYVLLGVYVPLIATNCLILERAENFAYRQTPSRAALDGFARGVGLLLVLLALGALREIFGKGTLLADLDKLFGPAAKDWLIHVMPRWYHFLLISLPPGAFIALGLLIALKNRITGVPARAPGSVVEAVRESRQAA